MAHTESDTGPLELPAWKSFLAVSSAIILALLFIIAGTWKITEPLAAAERMRQALVPAVISLPFAVFLGISETFAGVLLLVPRFRRWGAWLTAVLLVAFLFYMGIFYGRLQGEECNCFPWVRRAVGPAFFIGDLIMLLMAFFAAWWSRPSESRRSAVLVLAAVTVFALVSYGVTAVRQQGILAPAEIAVDGSPFALHQGRVLLYFFDPECSHCFLAAQEMSTFPWRDTRVVAVPTARAQFATQFLESSGLRASLSDDVDKLRKVFSFTDAPYAVALENGRQKAAFSHFEGDEFRSALARLGYLE